MAALPYIQLYVADYLADTMHLTTEEHGAYLLLIMNYWQTGRAIPKKRLASVARLSNERWTDVEITLNEFFTETPTGEWFHARIEQDLSKVKGKSEHASAAGKASAAKRAASKDRINTDHFNERSANVDDSLQRKGNHTDTDTDTDKSKHSVVEIGGGAGGGAPMEVIESAKPPRQKRPTALPEDFSPAETGIAYAVTRRLSLETELASFRNWHQAKGTTMKDWQAAWRTWCDKAVEFGRAGQYGGGGARASPAANSRDEGRRKVLEVLTGGGRNEQRSERDITGEAVRIAG